MLDHAVPIREDAGGAVDHQVRDRRIKQQLAQLLGEERQDQVDNSSWTSGRNWLGSDCNGPVVPGAMGSTETPVFVELGDGQAKRIDELELRKDLGLIANLLRVQVVGHTDHPMLGSRLPRVVGRVELVES